MKAWLLLGGAIVSEVAASLSLKAALDHRPLYIVVVVGYLSAFVLLDAVLRAGMALGVAYGVWGALGVAATAGLSAAVFDEPLTPLMITGMGLIIAGVLVVELGSQRASAREESA